LILLILIFNFSKAFSQEINNLKKTDLDSLEIDRIINFFDTVSIKSDTNYKIIEIDSIFTTDCDSIGKIDDKLKLYGFKSIFIKYIFKRNNNIYDSLFFYADCWGFKQVIIKNKWKKIVDIKNKYIFIFKDDKNTGFVEPNHLMFFLDSLNKLTEDKKEGFFNKVKLAGSILSNQMGIRFAGIGRVAGKLCVKLYIDKLDKKVWYWKKIVLKTEEYLKNGDIEVIEATDIKVNCKIPANFFKIPKNIKWQKRRIK